MKCDARPRIAVSLFLASLAQPCCAEPAPVIHYSPAENLEHVDVALIDSAQHEIDMAAYVLTDWPLMQALTRAADRGVAIRIYLDGTQLAERERAKVFRDLTETPGVEIRTKHETSAPMHLKSYQIDGRVLRTGAANFSASGLKRQDNDLIVIESAEVAASFKHNFDARFASGEALSAVASLMTATLRPLAAFALLAWSPALAQTICHDPPPGMACPGDNLVWCNTPSGVYHFQGERYFGCTRTGKFQCEHDAIHEGCRPTRNGQ